MKIKNQKLKTQNSFTLVELLLIVSILIFLTAFSFPVFRYFQRRFDLENSAQEIINTLRLAQNKTLASEGANSWGIYFSTSTVPHQYILFKGENFLSRESVFDEVYKLPRSVEIYEINFFAGESEIVFDRVTGLPRQFGKISLKLKIEPSTTKSIYLDNSGQIGLTVPSPPPDENRVKDSRHIHLNYSREISTSTEWLTLTFTYDGSIITKDIPISENLKEGQIYWEGEVNVGGKIQKLKIHTHRFNNPDTQFCIHRDRRYNDKALIIEINGDPDPDLGSLISYTAEGEIVNGTSIYVTNLEWQ